MNKKKNTIKNRVSSVVYDGEYSRLEYNITASAKIVGLIKDAIDRIEENYEKKWVKKK